MKINIVAGFFLPVPPVRGGATEKIWFRLAQQFAAAGHEVVFVSRQWPEFPTEQTTGGVRHLRVRGADHTRMLAWNLWRDFRWGMRVGRRLPPADVTICNTVSLPTWLRRRHPRVGRVVSVIARMPKGQTRFYGKVDLVLSLSDAVKQAIVRENAALSRRIMPFPFPIDWKLHADAAARQRDQATPTEPITIGYIGRIHPEKGIDLVLDAALRLASQTKIHPWRIKIMGPCTVASGGGGEAYLTRLRSRYGALLGDRLTISAPEFDPAALARHYAGIDVFCYPSLAESGETFGVAVAEAMAARCAPIVSALECFRELVIPNETGLVLDHHASDVSIRLADALSELIANSARRDLLATAARNHVRQFDFSVVGEQILGYLHHLITLPPSARFDGDNFIVESERQSRAI